MKHFIKNSNPEKINIVKDEQGNPLYATLDATINIGIEGEADVNISTGTTIRLELGDIAVALQKFNDGVAAFVAEKYPNE